MRGKRFKLAIAGKVVVSCLIVGWIVRSVDFQSLITVIGSADLWFLAVGFALMLCQVVVAGYRWSFIAKRSGLPLGFTDAFMIFWESVFFGQFLPSSMGGDVWRVYKAARLGNGVAIATHTVVVDRVSGAFALLLVTLLGCLMTALFVHMVDYRIVLLSAGTAAAIVCGLVVLVAMRPLLARLAERRLFAIVYTMASHISDTLRDRMVVSVAILTGVLGHLLTIVAAWSIAMALAVPITLSDCFLAVPVALLLALIPITIGGWGVREGAMTAGFIHLGAGYAQAVAVSLLFGGYLALLGATGGVVWVARSAMRGMGMKGPMEENNLALVTSGQIKDWGSGAEKN
jgi:uncharacterized protein (TIRG00374 family)